jgi:diamine N-acetyltransferase
MTVSLREINAETVRAICALETTEEQRRFVAPNALSIAQAHFDPTASFRAIHADETPVGFIMWRPSRKTDGPSREAGSYYLWRLMIDARYQRRGYGRSALALLADFLREQRGRQLWTSYVVGHDGPHGFYLSLGFEDTGEVMSHGERVMILTLLHSN